MQSMRPHPTVAHPRHARRRGALRAVGAAAAIAASGWMVASCSLIYDLSSEQCSTDLDCTSKGGVFADMVCRQNLCEVPVIDEGCTSNVECIDEPGFGGALRACIAGDCVPVTSADCPVLLPYDQMGIDNLRSSNPLILGGYANVTNEQSGDQLRNYNLALTELEQELGGLAGPNGTRRSVVMVVCNGYEVERESLDESLQHLIRLRVPGVVSALYGNDLQYVFENGGQQADMFFVSPLDADPVLTALPDGGLVWHLLPSTEYLARAYAPLLDRTLSYLDVTGGPVKVAAVVASDSRLLSDIMDTVRSPTLGIKFNAGKTVAENTADDNYLAVAISETDAEATYAQQIQAILDFKPHVILAAAADNFLEKMVPLIEQGWPVGAGEPPPPFYLLSPLHYRSGALDLVLADLPAVRSRLVGVNVSAAQDPTLYQEYRARWDLAYFDERGNGEGTENFYDAPYYLIYSAMAAGSGLQSGTDLAAGMLRLLSGPEYDIGPLDLIEVETALSAARSTITLNATMGPPDFDRPTGTRASVGTAWCMESPGVTRSDVLRYDAMSGLMEGSMESCIPGY